MRPNRHRSLILVGGLVSLLSGPAGLALADDLEVTWNGQAAHVQLLGSYPRYVIERADAGSAEFTLLTYEETGCIGACVWDDLYVDAGAAYDYRIRVWFGDGEERLYGPTRFAIDPKLAFRLDSVAVPNPMVGSTELQFRLPAPLARAGALAVALTLFDLQGREVRRVDAGTLSVGVQSILWDGRDDAGEQVRAGAYFYRLEAGAAAETGRILVVR